MTADGPKNQGHVLDVIRRKLYPNRKLSTICDEGAEEFPSDWHDELVCHTIRRNADGSITVIAMINVYGEEGDVWTAERTIRLERKSP